MLRSRRFMAVVFMLMLLLLALILAEETGSGVPDRVTSEADQYVRLLRSTTSENIRVARIVLAAQPAAFTTEMSKATYGDSVYYGTMHSLQGAAVSSAGRAVPFPPLNLWCVYIGASGKQATTIAFVGEHHDIYNADYILHEAVDVSTVLARVECPSAIE